MTKIEQLRAAFNGDPLDRGYSLTLEEAKKLLDLVEMQHEALKKYEQRQSMDDLESAGYAGTSAIEAFENWNKP